MLKCISKEKLNCFYFTKETKGEILNELEPHLAEIKCEIKENSKGIIVYDNQKRFKFCLYYNYWYVKDPCENEFLGYLEGDFKRLFHLVEE